MYINVNINNNFANGTSPMLMGLRLIIYGIKFGCLLRLHIDHIYDQCSPSTMGPVLKRRLYIVLGSFYEVITIYTKEAFLTSHGMNHL